MAKKSAKAAGEQESNKSEAIRQYITENPDAGPTAVAQALNERESWNISPAYVSTIKNKMKEGPGGGGGRRGKRRRAGRPSKAGAGTGGGGAGISEQVLLQAKELAKQVGGIDQAKAALELLDRLTN